MSVKVVDTLFDVAIHTHRPVVIPANPVVYIKVIDELFARFVEAFVTTNLLPLLEEVLLCVNVCVKPEVFIIYMILPFTPPVNPVNVLAEFETMVK